jgi:phytoene dehydrogenase-like protein
MEGGLKSQRVVIVGGGHNGLTAACYLAGADLEVTVLERLNHTGGAAVSKQIFPGVDVRLSRYAYLLSLLPKKIIADLGLSLELISRPVSSYTPNTLDGGQSGLLVERPVGAKTYESFEQITGDPKEAVRWVELYREIEQVAQVLAPTLLEPLKAKTHLREMVITKAGERIWQQMFEQPIGVTIKERLAHDLTRGVVATDALIGTFADLVSPDLLANKCFLYHLIGNGTGEWLVPKGGMGAVTLALRDKALQRGVEIKTCVEVTGVQSDGHLATVSSSEGEFDADWALLNYAEVDDFLADSQPSRPGAQMKVNMVLTSLPRLKSGIDPKVAFGGTFHMNESFDELASAYRAAESGLLPTPAPFETYCHTLADSSILGSRAKEQGLETLTLFSLHTPYELFEASPQAKDELVEMYFDAFDLVCVGSFREHLALDANGQVCVEVASPVDLEEDLRLPKGNIFQGDLSWPWAEPETPNGYQVGQWGVETMRQNVLICGSRAKRGGAVSGVGGHNAAHALLSKINLS